MKRTMTAMAVGAIVIGASGAQIQDWPQWRGPNRDGKAAGFAAPTALRQAADSDSNVFSS